MLNGPGDGAPPGLTLDRYAGWLLLSVREGVTIAAARDWARAALEALEPDGLVLKVLKRNAAESTSEVVAGVLPPEPIRIREDDAVLLVELAAPGASTGLFLDLHELRRKVRPYANDTDVLNLFAHTGAFSVHAALAKARRVTSVDVSRRALARGRENMIASGIDPDRHRWFPDDVLEHLARAARRGDRYGLVILDPPAFGRARNTSMSLERHLDALAGGAARVVAEGGVLAVAVHTRGAGVEDVLAAVERTGARTELLARGGLPVWDHPVGPAIAPELDRGEYLGTLVLRVG